MWDKEEIPDNSSVFTRIHKGQIHRDDGLPAKMAFRNTPFEGGVDLSCDWDKYSTPAASRALIGREKKQNGLYKNPDDFYIWAFDVLKLREIDSPQQKVEHAPIFYEIEEDGKPNNRAHSGIFGEKPQNDAKFRTKMLRAGEWAIPPDIQNENK